MSRRIVFEIEPTNLFNKLVDDQHLQEVLGDRMVDALLAPPGAMEALGLAFYGITVTDNDGQILPEPYPPVELLAPEKASASQVIEDLERIKRADHSGLDQEAISAAISLTADLIAKLEEAQLQNERMKLQVYHCIIHGVEARTHEREVQILNKRADDAEARVRELEKGLERMARDLLPPKGEA